MTTHTLSWPLTIEPPTSPPDDAPYFDCDVCRYEHDALDESGRCPQCADLCNKDKDDLVREIAELRADVEFLRAERDRLRRLVCADCDGWGVLRDDESSDCHCGRAGR